MKSTTTTAVVTLALLPLLLGACMASPKNNQLVDIQGGLTFEGYTDTPGEEVTLLAKRTIYPYEWMTAAVATTSTSPVYDNDGVAWYYYRANNITLPGLAWTYLEPWQYTPHGDDKMIVASASLKAVGPEGHALRNFEQSTHASCWGAENYVGMDIYFECGRDEETITVRGMVPVVPFGN